MKTTYYLYAGYYELHISAHKLSEPFVFISKHRKIDTAIRNAEKYDSDACVVAYKDTIDDILDYYGVDSQEDLRIPVADKEVA